MSFLKAFGKGLLWALLIPFILVGMLLAMVYGIFNFPYQSVKLLINFFTGRKMFPPFEEDKKAYMILKHSADVANGVATNQNPQPAPQPIYVQQNIYQTNPNAPLPPNIQLPNGQSVPLNQQIPQAPFVPETPIIDYSEPKQNRPVQIEQKSQSDIKLASFNQVKLHDDDNGGDF